MFVDSLFHLYIQKVHKIAEQQLKIRTLVVMEHIYVYQSTTEVNSRTRKKNWERENKVKFNGKVKSTERHCYVLCFEQTNNDAKEKKIRFFFFS